MPKTYEATLPGLGTRRRHIRYPVPADVMVVPQDARLDPFWATTEDVGACGVFINARRQPPIDADLMLKIVITPDLPALRVRAVVVHRIAGVGFGCRFAGMTPAISAQISRLIARASRARAARATSCYHGH